MPLESQDTCVDTISNRNWTFRKTTDVPDHVHGFCFPHGDPNANDCLDMLDSWFAEDKPTDPPPAADKAWEPLALYLKSLRHLHDFIFDSRTPIPPVVVYALQTNHSGVRLRLPNLRFRSLCDEETSKEELAIVTSPLLHQVSVRHRDNVDQGCYHDHNLEAALEMMRTAPNLKVMRLKIARIPLSPSSPDRWGGEGKASWNGFNPPPPRTRPAQLTTLQLNHFPLNMEQGRALQQQIDFSALRSLRVDRLLPEGNQYPFTHLLGQPNFPALKHFATKINSKPNASERELVAVHSFFELLPPLEDLTLEGTLDASDILLPILNRHGGTLRKLSLMGDDPATNAQSVNLDQMKLVQRECPMLQRIVFKVRRTRSDKNETGVYELLGKLPILEHVELHLDASPMEHGLPPHSPPDYFGGPQWEFEDYARQHYESILFRANGHIRDELLNAAVDEDLARQIWDAIVENKPESGPRRPLRILILKTEAFHRRHAFQEVRHRIINLARSFLLMRSEREGSHDTDMKLVETSEKRRRMLEPRDPNFWTPNTRAGVEEGRMRELWSKIWPVAESEDWRNSWKSLPLQRHQLLTSI